MSREVLGIYKAQGFGRLCRIVSGYEQHRGTLCDKGTAFVTKYFRSFMTRLNTNYRTAVVEPTAGDSIREAHSYEYDNNGNIVYVNTSRVKPDMTAQPDTVQRTREERFRWDEENRLTALSQNVTKEPSPCHIRFSSSQ